MSSLPSGTSVWSWWTQRLPRRAADGLAVVVLVIAAVFFALVCWQSWNSAVSSLEYLEASDGLIQIPVYPPKFAIPFGSALIGPPNVERRLETVSESHNPRVGLHGSNLSSDPQHLFPDYSASVRASRGRVPGIGGRRGLRHDHRLVRRGGAVADDAVQGRRQLHVLRHPRLHSDGPVRQPRRSEFGHLLGGSKMDGASPGRPRHGHHGELRRLCRGLRLQRGHRRHVHPGGFAGDAEVWLRQAARHRRHRGLGDPGSADPSQRPHDHLRHHHRAVHRKTADRRLHSGAHLGLDLHGHDLILGKALSPK